MKNITIYCSCIIVSLFVLLFMACESRKQVRLQELAARTHFQADFPDTFIFEPIGVYMVGENSSESCINLKYDNKDGVYSFVDFNELCTTKITTNKVNIYAYAPYRKDTNSDIQKHHITVFADQSDSINYIGSDFLYARVNNKDLVEAINVSLPFNHKFAKITINIKKSDLIESDNISFEITNVVTSVNMNLRTGRLSDLKDIGSIKPFQKKRANSGFDYTLEAIMIPQEIERNTPLFKFSIDGKNYSYSTRYSSSVGSSMQYICNIKVDNGTLSMESEEFPRVKGSSSDNIGAISERIYKIGDYYPIADDPLSAIGVVFSTVDNGAHGKILSLNEAVDLEWGPLLATGAKSKISGASNKVIIEKNTNNIVQYRALSWCLNKGKDWYLPAINELVTICKQKEALNRALAPLLRSNNLGNGVYVSSTEDSESKVLVLHFGNGQRFLQDKSLDFHVRAVCDF